VGEKREAGEDVRGRKEYRAIKRLSPKGRGSSPKKGTRKGMQWAVTTAKRGVKGIRNSNDAENQRKAREGTQFGGSNAFDVSLKGRELGNLEAGRKHLKKSEHSKCGVEGKDWKKKKGPKGAKGKGKEEKGANRTKEGKLVWGGEGDGWL